MWSILLLIVIGIGAALLDLFKGFGKSFKSLSKKTSNFAENVRKRAVNAKERRSLRIKYDNAINNSQCIEKINECYEQFNQNKQLLTICKNLTSMIACSLRVLEFSFIPYFYSTLFEQPYRLNTNHKCIKTNDFLKQVSLYNQNIIDEYQSYVKFAHTILLNLDYYNDGCCNYGIKKENGKGLIFDPYAKNRELTQYPNENMDEFSNSYLEIQEEIREIFSTFSTLINQEIINCDNNMDSFFAFLYLIYKLKKQDYIKESKKLLKHLGLSFDSTEETIISTMFDNDIDSSEISTTILSLRSKKNNLIDIMTISFKQVEGFVNNKLKDLKEKQKVKSLLNKNINNSNQITITDIDLMSGAEFEEYITYLFNQLGYKASNTKLSGDQGIDVIATKGVTKIAIQCKCFSKPVGNHAVMEAVAGGKYYNADKVMVVTNNTFTKSARELAKANNVLLWDRKILKEKMEGI